MFLVFETPASACYCSRIVGYLTLAPPHPARPCVSMAHSHGLVLLARCSGSATDVCRTVTAVEPFLSGVVSSSLHLVPLTRSSHGAGLSCAPMCMYHLYRAPRSWATRVKPEDLQSGLQGVAIEYIIALCNQVRAVPWLPLPRAVDANDSYLRGIANLLVTTLDPSLNVIFEFAHGLLFGQVRFRLRLSSSRACVCLAIRCLLPLAVVQGERYSGLQHHARRVRPQRCGESVRPPDPRSLHRVPQSRGGTLGP
jgi:hypothetical protein